MNGQKTTKLKVKRRPETNENNEKQKTNSNTRIQPKDLNPPKTDQKNANHPETTWTAQNDAKRNKTTNRNQTSVQIATCQNKRK